MPMDRYNTKDHSIEFYNMKIGITLSGGGLRGVGHLGVLEALEQMGIKIDHMVGVSSGSIMAAMYAHGYKPREVLEILKQTKLLRFVRPKFKRGLLNIERLGPLLLEYLPHDSFEQLKTPLTVAASDIQYGKLVYFDKGALIKPLMASSCIPVMFSPVEYDGKILVDGGLLNNMPTAPIRDCQLRIGVHCNPIDPAQPLKSTRKVLERSMILIGQKGLSSQVALCDIMIEPPALSQYTTFELKKIEEMYNAGFEHTMSKREEILEVIEHKK